MTSKRNYERLAIEDFGKHLLESGDLDPIYIALRKTFVHPAGSIPALKRWMVAYWCLYHAGTACYLSDFEGREFWLELKKAAANTELSPTGERWQRGHERRHFRGEASVKAVRTMMGRYLDNPADLVNVIIGDDEGRDMDRPFMEISQRAQELPLFGPWIGFKVGDMIDRVLGIPIDFDNAAVFMFDDPTKAALRLWRLKAGIHERYDTNGKVSKVQVTPKDKDKAINQVVDYLIEHFRNFQAPPLGDRPVGLQEVETILCKWKSHMNGHYPLYNDIDEINDGIKPWVKHSQTALNFAAAMPQNPARKT
jgi:hypothetical protein